MTTEAEDTTLAPAAPESEAAAEASTAPDTQVADAAAAEATARPEVSAPEAGRSAPLNAALAAPPAPAVPARPRASLPPPPWLDPARRPASDACNETLVFLPGAMADARAFLPQLVHFGAKRELMIARTCGADSIERIAIDTLARCPGPLALVGHGLGADVAVEMLRRAPERICRIVLMACDPLAEPRARQDARDRAVVMARAGRLAEALLQDVPVDAFAAQPWRDEIIALVEDMGLTLGAEVYAEQSRARQRRPDQQRVLRNQRVPALVIGGLLDPLVPPRRHAFLAELMPQAQLEMIADAGHMPQLEQPEAVNAVLEAFLAPRKP